MTRSPPEHQVVLAAMSKSTEGAGAVLQSCEVWVAVAVTVVVVVLLGGFSSMYFYAHFDKLNKKNGSTVME